MSTRIELLQAGFAGALADSHHESALLDELAPSDMASERIGLYRGNLQTNWHGALAGAYPVLRALVGDMYFDALARAYARAHPSVSGDLNRFGDALPPFVERYEPDSRFRYFGDIARLEWALHCAYFASDVEPFSSGQWIELGGDRLLEARLCVHPACAAIASSYAIADVWLAHQPGEVFPADIDVPSWVLVVRPQWRPVVIKQSAAAHAAFVGLRRGESLNEALDAAFAMDAEFDFARQWQQWVGVSAITGSRTGEV
jgi:Putative DNA-binding domain